MIIDLTKIPIYWNTIEKNIDRHKKMQSMFKQMGVSNTTQLNGEIIKPYTIGIARSHIKSLSNSLPVLVLEDDCQLVKDFTSTIQVPDDADAVYLGTSLYGMIQGRTTFGGAISSIYNDDYLRVYNMLGIHAVLYLTESYRSHIINTLNNFTENPIGGCDDPIAMTMKNYKIYALRNPMFYQNDGHSENATKTPLNPLF
jgi:hypothetical protein